MHFVHVRTHTCTCFQLVFPGSSGLKALFPIHLYGGSSQILSCISLADGGGLHVGPTCAGEHAVHPVYKDLVQTVPAISRRKNYL